MVKRLRRSLRSARGATVTEMVVLIVLVALAVMAGIKALGSTMGAKMDEANTRVAQVSTEQVPGQYGKPASSASGRAEEAGATPNRAAAPAQATPGADDPDDASKSSARGESGDPQLVDAPDVPRQRAAPVSNAAAPPDDGCGGFNPFLIPMVLGLLGLLGYVIGKSKKG